ncbi:glycosyltransferase family 2 protein [Flavihumibacter solisilvae]|uniref:Glycosyltransferase 2-like domain-containing protein n=1 Tax=Flavihumibacter solisilvae TaxID=1349421 RepID=A0A0C1IW01_9BACT|nr:glycosyltransferase family 2 protein [Flavihumibacter solisilvae]KIC94654.1 hypothetical protein OI18_11255 [Flavihumibacter solisilvae]
MQSPHTLVYFVIVTYNGEQWIHKCLDSVFRNQDMRVKAIVIDNGSQDRTVEVVRDNYPQVKLIETGRNLGFGQANNIGIKVALNDAADFLFLLNQDAWLVDDCLSTMISFLESHWEIGVLSPVHLNGTGNDIDRNFSDYLQQSDLKQFFQQVLMSHSFKAGYIETEFVNAAAWLVSRECIEKVGGFDPVFFHYGEDNNFLQRVKYWGYKICILTSVYICHDREQRPVIPKVDFNHKLKRDWTIFMGTACNVNNPLFYSVIFSKFIRHLAGFFKSSFLLRFPQARYNLSFCRKILANLSKIRKSRKGNVQGLKLIYLK